VKLLKLTLENQGYEVVAAGGSLEALEQFKTDPNAFDLVISDMAMPHMAGDRLSQELLKIRSDIPIILCTGYSERIDENSAKAIGAKAFALKPIVMKDMLKTVQKVLDETTFAE
jgi:CheY-like chemotaxis protein